MGSNERAGIALSGLGIGYPSSFTSFLFVCLVILSTYLYLRSLVLFLSLVHIT